MLSLVGGIRLPIEALSESLQLGKETSPKQGQEAYYRLLPPFIWAIFYLTYPFPCYIETVGQIQSNNAKGAFEGAIDKIVKKKKVCKAEKRCEKFPNSAGDQ